MEYKYINNTFTSCEDIKIPDGEYILMNADSFSFLLLSVDKFEAVINSLSCEKEKSPDVTKLLRVILSRALQVTCEDGKINYGGPFFGIVHEGIFSVEGENGFFVIKSGNAPYKDYTPSPLQSIIEKILKEQK